MNRVILFLLVLLCIPAVSSFGESQTTTAPKNSGGVQKPLNARFAALSALPPIRGGTLVLGDSITAAQDLSDLFGTPIHNRAVSGVTTGEVLTNLDILFRGTPDRVFILLGINDIVRSVGKKQFVGNYRAIADRIRTASPGSRVYAMSILPTSNTRYNASVFVLNDLLKYFAPKMNAVYIDLHSRLLTGTVINPEYVMDGIHLSGQGYVVLKDALTPYLLENQVQ